MTSKLPRTDSIEELARFWDSHDVTEFGDELVEVNEPVFVRNGAKILGHGEDALTYWALTARLPSLLALLHDASSPHHATVVYSPGFGRSGGSRGRRAEFGDFDAIIGTKQAVYLIESKCSRWPRTDPPEIRLTDAMIRRNSIFRWYRDHWDPGEEWEHFVARCDEGFRGLYPANRLAPASSRLGAQLQYVLGALSDSGRATIDILLYFYPKVSIAALPSVKPPSVRLVPFPYEPIDNAAFIRLTA